MISLSADSIRQTYRADLKHGRLQTITRQLVVSALDDEFKVFTAIGSTVVSRSFPVDTDLTPAAAEILRQVLERGNIPFDQSDDGINLCCRKGWLHTEALDYQAVDVRCFFPSKLHKK